MHHINLNQTQIFTRSFFCETLDKMLVTQFATYHIHLFISINTLAKFEFHKLVSICTIMLQHCIYTVKSLIVDAATILFKRSQHAGAYSFGFLLSKSGVQLAHLLIRNT